VSRIAVACDGEALPADLLDLLAAAGLPLGGLREWRSCESASLTIREDELEWLVAPSDDVIAACSCGGAAAGVVGKDLLLERGAGLCELLDLGVARGRLVHAARRDARPSSRRPRIATCYPHATHAWFAARGRDVDPLAVATPALAVALGIAGSAVDLEARLTADGGEWLVLSEVAACSARLVAGRQARVLHTPELAELIDRLREAQEEEA
jgi:ATP phosphoribosyltransferase